MKDSIDYAITNARDYNEFIKILQDLDYIVTEKNNTLSIRREPYKRILETQPEFPYSPEPYLLIHKTYKSYNKLKEKYYQ